MGNKGQSLVVFVLLLPVIFILFTIIWEFGNLSFQISYYKNEVKSTIRYGLNHLSDDNLEEKLNTLIVNNIKGKSKIEIKNNTIKINIKTKYENIYSKLLHISDIDITYVGYKENNKLIIKEE